MTVTMRDVAKHAGVSQRTVSNVVTGSVPVRPETREKVEASIRELGYRTFAPARQLRQGRTSTVALALPSLTEPYFAELAQCVIDRARKEGLRVHVVTTASQREDELSILRGEQLFADGVIMSAVALTPDDEPLMHSRFPLVLVGDRSLGSHVTHVGPDNHRAGYEAVKHMVSLGRRRIALLGARAGPAETCELRTAGYLEALAEAAIAPDPKLMMRSGWDFDSGVRTTLEAIDRSVELDGIFAMNDSSALGALKALHQRGLAVPGDVAIAGFDNTRDAARSTPGLTSIGPRPDEVAAAALRELRSLLDDVAEPAQCIVAHELIERGSTRAARA